MSNLLTYKGYSTKVEYSAEDNLLYGKIEGIADLVNFECDSASDAERAFQEAVDDYLVFCEEVGKAANKEYKGSFNVRISPSLHRELDRRAYAEGTSMNQLIERAIRAYIEGCRTMNGGESVGRGRSEILEQITGQWAAASDSWRQNLRLVQGGLVSSRFYR
ncbi:MAG: type II toxin-antitoxin system HicB family antitoxin [Clostridiales bacterium]|nr:type II toxin-antitoxin system HicB family antitoxin [Clostridiales bacterium]